MLDFLSAVQIAWSLVVRINLNTKHLLILAKVGVGGPSLGGLPGTFHSHPTAIDSGAARPDGVPGVPDDGHLEGLCSVVNDDSSRKAAPATPLLNLRRLPWSEGRFCPES